MLKNFTAENSQLQSISLSACKVVLHMLTICMHAFVDSGRIYGYAQERGNLGSDTFRMLVNAFNIKEHIDHTYITFLKPTCVLSIFRIEML